MKRLGLLALLGLCGLSSRAQTSALPTGDGLNASYYNGINFETLAARRRDAAIDFDWRKEPPVEGLGSEYFSVRWEGFILAPVTGDYEFSTVMDDGLRVWVGGKRIIDAWREQDHVPAVVHLKLEAGRYYRLRVDYFQTILDSRALLRWRLPDAPAPVPMSGKYFFAALPPSAKPVPLPAPKPAPVVAERPAPQPAPAAPPVRPAPVVVARRPARSAPRPAAAVRRPAPEPAAAVAPVAAAPVAAPGLDSLPDLGTLTKGTAVALKNLYFEQGKARLLPASQPELNRLVRQLRAHTAAQFEIAGHTDNVGNAVLNQQLSEQRAQLVRAYLVQRGIDSARLTAVGYGGTRPVADNRDPQQRPRNRRVELVAR